MTKRRNTFTKQMGSTYKCDCCGRGTRNTGVQSMGSKTCPQCFELAGISNEISDGHCTLAERRADIDALVAEIRAKGGTPDEFADLLPAPEPAAGFGVTLYAKGDNRAEPQVQFVGETIEAARAYIDAEIAKSDVPAEEWTRGETFGDEFAECARYGFNIHHGRFA